MKVLLINPEITNYRIGIYEMIGKELDLTVLHFGKYIDNKNLGFKQLNAKLLKLGPFYISKIFLHRICSKFDIIISDGNLRYLDRNLLILNPFRTYKWINWGIGLSASLDKKLDSDTRFDFFRFLIFRNVDAHLLYSDYPIMKYLSNRINSDKLFVAWNTIINNDIINLTSKKDSIIFVGSLYKQKGIFELLEVYKIYILNNNFKFKLHIVGGGQEYDSIKSYIYKYNLNQYIYLHGPIYDPGTLAFLYSRSFLSISPNQAGLSVLTSMSYGVPFVTKRDAITGGEIFSIKHLFNGYFYNSKEELLEILINIEKNQDFLLNMGENARTFYLEQRAPEKLVKKVIESCNYVLNS